MNAAAVIAAGVADAMDRAAVADAMAERTRRT
jgi:hypothetical protein